MDEQNKNTLDFLRSLTEKDFKGQVDLHMHSNFSDGKLTPQELLQDAQKKGYRKIAIADHNTVEGYKKTNILESDMVITAVEFDCWYKGVLVHLLGYGVDVNNENLLKICAKSIL